MSRSELADAVNAALNQLYPKRDLTSQYVDHRWVGKLERGEHRWPSEERRAALRHVFGVPTDIELDLYSPRRTDSVSARRAESEIVTHDIGLPSEALRRLLHSGATGTVRDVTTVVAATDNIRHIIDEALDDGFPLSAKMQQLESAVTSHARDALTVAPFEMISRMALDFLATIHLIRHGPTISSLQRLRMILAKLAVLTADEMNVVGQTDAARAWYATATVAADKSEVPELRADIRALAAMLPLYHGHPAAAIHLAQQARRLAGKDRNCMARALAPMLEALGWAHLGSQHRDRAQAALSHAKRAYDATTEEVRAETVFGFSPRRRLFYEGRLLTKLAEYPAAWIAHRQALELYPHDVVGDRAIISLDRAAGLIASDQPGSGSDLILTTLGTLPREHCAPIFTATASKIIISAPQKMRMLPTMRACSDLLADLHQGDAIGPNRVR
ncbi:hypothetical protein KIF24_24485 [Micromonospora sp. Llam7]|uniref:hypothetical protein n=1 Tax=Micromonospora tarapacensis TaxID=2835305 RepID=UPI001C840697|nr:hypothetical protein [Micromonospora tarapacensis]MBX7268871.1 hypothetical protein [Micromonospora tarapacensis]